jgi:hypothetical protein
VVRSVTLALWGAGAGLVVAGASQLAARGSFGGGVMLAAGAMLVALCLVYRRLQPTGYRLDATGLEVERRSAHPLRFSGASTLVPGARLGFRWYGSGGLYGYLGRFGLRGAPGSARAYVTARAHLVVLDLDGTRVAISPHDSDELFERLGGVDG